MSDSVLYILQIYVLTRVSHIIRLVIHKTCFGFALDDPMLAWPRS